MNDRRGSFHHYSEDRRNYENREGQPFDDSSLIARGYIRTVYDYELADGTLLYQQNRYDKAEDRLQAGVDAPKKKFLPCRPLATFDRQHNIGDRILGAGPRRVIFNWPAIVRAGPGSTVLVPEGEKKAKDLIAAGLLATTVISHKWTDECIAALTGFDVILLEDHDDDGRKLAAKARDLLSKVAKSIRVVPCAHLWKYLDPARAGTEPPPNGDVSDWLYYGGDATKLLKICCEIPAEGSIAANSHDFPAEETIPMWDFLYGKHLLRGTVSGTAAPGGTGKSSMSIAEALALTSAKLILGVPVSLALRVVLINLEDDRNTMNKRIAAAMKHHGLTKEQIGDRLIVIARGEIKLKVAKQLRSGDVERNELVIKALTNLMIEHRADVLSVDSFIRTHKVNENDNSAIEEVVECFEDVALAANCAVHLWHHTRKDGGQGASVDSARGAKAFIDACRSVRIFETMTKEGAQKLRIEHPGFYFRSFSGKRNFAPPLDKSDWFKFVSVSLNNSPLFGDDVGVVERWQFPGTQEPSLTPHTISEIKTVVGAARWREDVRADMWVGKAVARVFGLDAVDDGPAVKKMVKKLISMSALKTEQGQDSKRQWRTFVVPGDGPAPVSQVGQAENSQDM
jgi:hypothetical protein